MTISHVHSLRVPSGRGFWRAGIIAGFAGGVAEIGWISLYQYISGHPSADIARGVTQSVIPTLTTTPSAVPLGIAIHMALAVLLGIAICLFVRKALPRIAGTILEPALVVGILVGVWVTNFFVVLPAINPDFVTLVPYGVSLTSKVLFGFSAALVFWSGDRAKSNK